MRTSNACSVSPSRMLPRRHDPISWPAQEPFAYISAMTLTFGSIVTTTLSI